MKFTLNHNNLNVLDLEKSLAFYEQAFGLVPQHIKEAADGSFKLAFLTDGETPYMVELTWLRDRTQPYNLGDNEIHLCLAVDDFAAAHSLHQGMGCICYENTAMGLYFVADPDGYWTEIISKK